MPVHLQPAYSERVIVYGNLHESERAAREVVSLPLYPELEETDVQKVCDVIEEYHMGVI
jgi:dTDP-4-amino-4,6-dideoxygalactose transaminase